MTILTPSRSCNCLMVSPPLPMTSPTLEAEKDIGKEITSRQEASNGHRFPCPAQLFLLLFFYTGQTLYKGLEGTVKCCLLYQGF